MTALEIERQRLAQQRLSHSQLQAPEEVVAWLGAVQAQEVPGALWSLGLRMQAVPQSEVERAFDAGRILRTHIMRPTWHFVTPADIRWLLELTAPRVYAASAYMLRQVELDETAFARSNEVIVRTLRGGNFCTRRELGVALAQAGIRAPEGVRLGYLLMGAEIEGIICSGPRRGKQFTYALLEERAPGAERLPYEAALAELARRYFTAHGPATARDFSWWSGLTLADAREGLDLLGAEMEQLQIDGKAYYIPSFPLPAGADDSATYLLPTYDEFLVGYTGFDRRRRGGQASNRKIPFNARIMAGGRIIGSWHSTLQKSAALVEVAPFAPLTGSERFTLAAAVQHYEAFVGLPVEMKVL